MVPIRLATVSLVLVSCGGPRLSDDARVDHVVATDPPTISWTPPEASWVEVRQAASGRVVWRVVAGGGLRGADPVRSPLTYGAAGRTAGVFPPDNAGTQSVVGPEPLGPAVRYFVTINRCVRTSPPTASDVPPPDPCEITTAFTTSNTIPMGTP